MNCMKNKKAKSVKICCDECKYEFSMNSVNIQEAIINIGRQALKLVYFVCPECNKIYRISLEDERYNELKEDLAKTKRRLLKNYDSKDMESARVLNDMVNKKHQRLKNHLENLNNKFPGTFTFVTSENNNEEKIIKYLP